MWKSLLLLARGSNIPTVWSNIYAATLLSGSAFSPWSLTSLLTGATLVYAAGCTLNDACDARWDAQHRPTRPIPSGQLTRRQVFLLGGLELGFGLGLMGAAVPVATGQLAWLAAVILLYDAWHKQNPASVLLMGACRFFLYRAVCPQSPLVCHAGVLLAAYIVLLSLVARREARPASQQALHTRWPLLLIPLMLGCYAQYHDHHYLLPVAATTALWLTGALCLLPRGAPPGKVVAYMLAAIPLIDLGVTWTVLGWTPQLLWFPVLFLTARLAQRWIPST